VRDSATLGAKNRKDDCSRAGRRCCGNQRRRRFALEPAIVPLLHAMQDEAQVVAAGGHVDVRNEKPGAQYGFTPLHYFAAIGLCAAARAVYVVHVERRERDRIISARLATLAERDLYANGE
jgi:hypothetical protein